MDSGLVITFRDAAMHHCLVYIDLDEFKAINEIGHTTGPKTIAEYEENDGILREISELGVDLAQGYGIAQPRPVVPSQQATEAAGA